MTSKCAILVRIETAPATRMWFGVGDLRIPADHIESDETALYLGIGHLASIPTLQSLINGVAERVSFSVSGAVITSEIVRLADDEFDSVRYKDVYVGVRRFDQYDQPTGPVRWVWNGVADSTDLSRPPAGIGDVQQSVGLSVASIFTFRQRPAASFFTPVDQKRRSSDDTFCDNVGRYNVDTTKIWKPT